MLLKNEGSRFCGNTDTCSASLLYVRTRWRLRLKRGAGKRWNQLFRLALPTSVFKLASIILSALSASSEKKRFFFANLKAIVTVLNGREHEGKGGAE